MYLAFRIYLNLSLFNILYYKSSSPRMQMRSRDAQVASDYIFYKRLAVFRREIDALCQCFVILEVIIRFENDFGCRRNYTKTPFILRVDKPLRNRSYRSRVGCLCKCRLRYHADSLVWQVSRVAMLYREITQ